MPTLYQLHKEKWASGCGSTLCEKAKHVCLFRGSVPCDILFIGEAPGPSENLLGVPFKGPAGHLLDGMIAATIPKEVRLGFGNLVGCIPLNDGNKKFAEPPPDAIRCCSGRLKELIAICSPRLIVQVGELAEKWLPGLVKDIPRKPGRNPVQWCKIMHPAAILRAKIENKGLLTQRNLVALRDAVSDLADNPPF